MINISLLKTFFWIFFWSSPPPCLHGQLVVAEGLDYGVLIVESAGYRKSVTVDSTATFDFCDLPATAVKVDLLLYRGLGTDTLFLGTVPAGRATLVHVPVPAKLRTNLLGHFICPKCRRADKTARIVNGEAPLTQRIIVNGDTSYTSIIHRRIHEGCINTGSQGYCSRDRIRF